MSYKNKFNSILPAAENFLTSNSFNKILLQFLFEHKDKANFKEV